MTELPEQKRAHLIGICGVGMFGIAKMLLDDGWIVSGSDQGYYPPVSEELNKLPIRLHTAYKPENIPATVNLIVIGKHARLTSQHNYEVRRAFEIGVPIRSFPEILEELTRFSTNIVVAGSAGKSTTTTLIAWILHYSGLDPSYFIGAIPEGDFKPAARGKSAIFVLEGDEYPSANWDSTSKFLYYHATHVVLTSCEHDHLNQFPTHESYLAPFRTLVSRLPADGILVSCCDDPSTQLVTSHTSAKVVTYSIGETTPANWRVRNLQTSEKISFDLYRDESLVCQLTSDFSFGQHNAANILGASATLLELGLVSPRDVQLAVRAFRGIRRRLSMLSATGGAILYEDIASSRQKARATIKALRQKHPDRRCILIFEPYSLSFRHRNAEEWYENLFDGVDLVLLLCPRDITASQVSISSVEIIRSARRHNSHLEVVPIESIEQVEQYLRGSLQENDLVIIMSSGGSAQLSKKVRAVIEEG